MKQNNQFYIVATPIGNILDITFRAIEILKEIDFIVSEDTRVTLKLLNHYNIKKPQICYNDHSAEKDREKIIRLLQEGKKLALVSDAGTPLISDPGYKLIQDLIQAEISFTTIPGPSSTLSALILSGLPTDKFIFLGYLPPKKAGRVKTFQEVKNITSTLIFFESPNRIKDTLEDINEIFPIRQVALIREITKLFEEAIRGTAQEILEKFHTNVKGEMVVIIEGAKEIKDDADINMEQDIALLKEKLSTKDLAEFLAKKYNKSKTDIYKGLI